MTEPAPLPQPPRVAAIVPMRHESERVPGKNYRPFAGQPLYAHVTGDAARGARPSGRSSSTPTARSSSSTPRATSLGAADREAAGAARRAVPMNDVLLKRCRAGRGRPLLCRPTAPTRCCASRRSARALETLIAVYPAHDSLFGVTRLQTRLWDAAGRPLNHDPARLLRTQDLPPVYEENSCLYLFTGAACVGAGTGSGSGRSGSSWRARRPGTSTRSWTSRSPSSCS